MNKNAQQNLSRVAQTLISTLLTVIVCSYLATAQALSTDTLSTVRCTNVVVMPPSSVEFDIVLGNISRADGANTQPYATWEHWANGTFFLDVRNAGLQNVAMQIARCELDSTSLPLAAMLGNGSRSGYEVKVQVQPTFGRIAIAILGADSLQNCVLVQRGTERLLGRFRVEFPDSLLNAEQIALAWAQPLERFQANAFKVAQSLRFQGIQLAAQDNCEMITKFSVDAPVVELPPSLTASSFVAEYAGDKRVRLTWRTSAERTGRRTNAGFVVLRKNLTLGSTAAFDTVADFRTASTLRLRGNVQGSVYEILDSVRSRGDVLLYRLVALDATPARTPTSRPPALRATLVRDTASVRIPNAVIIRAAAEPNPFSQQTTIRYELEDRARISATLYDATGRIIARLAENIEQGRGVHTLSPDVTHLAVQGALLLVLTALPNDDAAVERSETVLKLQRLR